MSLEDLPDSYFPKSPPSLFTFLATQLLKSMEREQYLHQRLLEQGVLNKQDIETLNELSDWQRIPMFEAVIRDKAIDHLNTVVDLMKESVDIGGFNEED